jgi:hypothetical protein
MVPALLMAVTELVLRRSRHRAEGVSSGKPSAVVHHL